MSNTLVSIVMPLFNSSGFMSRAIDSVFAQTYKDWELIIIDDCSNDGSYEIAYEYAKKDKRVKLIRQTENKGSAVTRNLGIENAKGRFIAFLDSDDIWVSQKLEKQIKFMLNNEAVLSYTAYQKMDERGNLGGVIYVPPKVSYTDILKSNRIGCSTAIYDTEKLGKLYMPNIRRRQDHGLWLKILKIGYTAYGIDEPLTLYRIRQDSISGNKIKTLKDQWRIYREIEQLSLLKSIYYFTHYAYNGFKKYRI
jgi:glycosyltransferase involved in cell wall biosynthesis